MLLVSCCVLGGGKGVDVVGAFDTHRRSFNGRVTSVFCPCSVRSAWCSGCESLWCGGSCWQAHWFVSLPGILYIIIIVLWSFNIVSPILYIICEILVKADGLAPNGSSDGSSALLLLFMFFNDFKPTLVPCWSIWTSIGPMLDQLLLITW